MNRLLAFRNKKIVLIRSLVNIKDVTGNIYRSGTSSISDSMDEVMIDIISGNNFTGPKLAEMIKISGNSCIFANILELYEKMRYSLICNVELVKADFIYLEEKMLNGKLSKREGLFAAAALQWYEGQYFESGLLLETVLLDSPGDVLALRLAQDAYIAAGSSRNVLGCIIRHNPASDIKPHMHGYLLGLLSTGFVETGKIEMAIETAQQAIAITRGENCWALHSILNSYQLSGKSSDMQYVLSEFISKHHESTGVNNLMYNAGSASIMRGNYSGAYKILEEMIDLLEDKTSSSYNNALLWRNIVLLLCKLNTTTANPDLQHSAFGAMWLYLSKNICCDKSCFGNNSIHDFCISITLLAATKCDINDLIKKELKDIDKAGNSSNSNFNWLKNLIPVLPNTEGKDNVDSVYIKIKENILDKYGFVDIELARISLSNAQSKLLKHIQDLETSAHKSNSDDQFCPKLRSIKPTIRIVNCSSNITTQTYNSDSRYMYYSDSQWSTLQCTLPFTQAFQHYYDHDHKSSCLKFEKHLPQLNLLGGMAVQRELLHQMYIQSLCSDNQLELAKLILTERSVLVPNDAQCWSKLAIIYRLLGQIDRAEEAHYTSWQLGIGQGGFGGPK